MFGARCRDREARCFWQQHGQAEATNRAVGAGLDHGFTRRVGEAQAR
jgi:hypothetical protein